MPLFKFRKNKDHQSASGIDNNSAPHVIDISGGRGSGRPPLNGAVKQPQRGSVKSLGSTPDGGKRRSFRFGKKKKDASAAAEAAAAAAASDVDSLPPATITTTASEPHHTSPPQQAPVSPLKRDEVDVSLSSRGSSRSLGAGSSGLPQSSAHHEILSSGDDNSSHGSTSAASDFKKASLRRNGSFGNNLNGSTVSTASGLSQASGNPKTLAHSASAIGLDEMIEDRREVGTLGQNVVHIEVPFGKPIEEVYEGVHNGPVLGSGISGMVRLVTHKATGLKYAVKVLDLGLVETPTGLQQLREEIFIMCQLDHPNIVRLEEVYESHTEIYLVQELCLGGELFDRLDEQPDYHYTEAECARLVKQMLSAVRYLHSKGIIHRDLKLENFLFSSVYPDSELKMIDFGLSKHFRYGEVHHEAVGTPYTVAPEVIRGEYDERCDIWAIGVITFLLLSGEPPFGGCGGPEPLMTVRSNILQGRYHFEPADIWELVSKQALLFIQTLLVTDPSKRPTAMDAQKHEWFQEWAKRKPQNNQDNVLNPNVVKALVNFKEFSDMRKLLCEVLSFTLLPDQIKDLRQEFEKMDTDGSGEISLAALKQVLMKNAGDGSLGALTEEEVTDIFDAMRVRKTETRIHWHEFIAAGLSQCSVDDRNLRLAFERLDSDHKGYITLDDIMDLMGSDALQSEDEMRRMWGDSIKAVKCQHARITYDDFLLLMKGQSRENPPDVRAPPPPTDTIAMLGSSLQNLKAVPESDTLSGDSHDEDLEKPAQTTTPEPSEHFKPTPTPGRQGSVSAPTTPADHKKIIDVDEGGDDDFESPLSMDDELPVSGSLTPPITPERGINDYLSPRNSTKIIMCDASHVRTDGSDKALFMPSFPDEPYVRRRSRSLGQERDPEPHDDSENTASRTVESNTSGDLNVVAEAVRDLILPEHEHHAHTPVELEEVVKDKSKSALVVNRRLYRAHRQMRMAVLEASKRFEEQQAQHAKEVILAQRKQNELNGDSPAVYHAGLVMRHGHTKQVSSEAIRSMLARDRAEQQSLVEKATRRGGRGRRSRKKTISDMSGMLSNMGSEEFNAATAGANPITPPDSKRNSFASHSEPFTPTASSNEFSVSAASSTEGIPAAAATTTAATTEAPVEIRSTAQPPPLPIPTTAATTPAADAEAPPDIVASSSSGGGGDAKEGTMRSATVPGEFRKTSDPFGSKGKYGRSSWQ